MIADIRLAFGRLARTVLILGTAFCLAVGSPQIARAQTAPPAPVREAVDANGVDLFHGTFNVDAPAISMGGAESGLAFRRTNRGANWTDTTIGYLNLSGSTMTVSIGPFSDRFNVSGSTYTSTEGNGSTLTYNGTSEIYTYTRADGTIVLFDETKLNELAPYGNTGLITEIASPSGETQTYAYESVQYCKTYKPSGIGYICEVYGYAFRLASVTSSYGYRLQPGYSYTYEYNPDEPWSQPDWYQFSLVTGMNGLNLASSASTVQASQSYSTETIGGYNYYVVTDSLSRQTKFKIAGAAVGGIILPGDTAESISVAYTGGLVTGITAAGATTTYARSDAGNTRTVTVTPPLGSTIVYAFDIAKQRMTSVTVNDGTSNLTTSYAYDSSGRLTRTTYPEGNYVELTYDARGNVTERRHVAKTAGTPADIVTTASYPGSCGNPRTCNRPTWTRDARNKQTDYTYDATHGGVLTVTAPADADGVRPQTRYGYTSLQAYYYQGGSIVASGVPIYRLTTVAQCRTTASCTGGTDERKTTIDYGPQTAGTGNNLLPAGVTLARGDGALAATTNTSYDAVGNVVSVDGPQSGTADRTLSAYDAVRRPLWAIGPDPDGGGAALFPVVRYAYRSDGQIDRVETGTVTAQSSGGMSSFTELQRITVTYDGYHRPIRQVLRGGSTDYQVADQRYNVLGQIVCVMQRMDPSQWSALATDCNPQQTGGPHGPDRVTRYAYDALGRTTIVREGYGTVDQAPTATLTYTDNGRLATIEDAEDNLTTYEYDGFDRLVKTRFPDLTTGSGTSSTTDYEQVGYDAAGNVTSFRTRRNETLTLVYDNLDRLTRKALPNRAGDWCGLGSAAACNTHERDVYFAYDLFGNMTLAAFGSLTGSDRVENAFDALGQMTGSTLVMDGVSRALGYQYDVSGNRTRITHPDSNYFTYARHPSGALARIDLGASLSMLEPVFDAEGRVYRLNRWRTTAEDWASRTQFGFDNLSRLASYTTNVNGTTYDDTTTFAYNPASQIASLTRSNDAQYAFPDYADADTGYARNGLNQYSAVAGTSFGYDLNGNLTSNGADAYAYDLENRLVGRSGGASASLRYDPLGRLYEVTGAGGTRRFLHDGSDLVAEYDASGTLLRRYVHGLGAGDDALVWFEGSGVSDSERHYLYADERGSIVAVTSGTGAVLGVNAYDEYGVPASGNLGAFQYTGQVWLPEVGTSYYKARMYSPTLGRFMQTDPIGYGDGMNMYAYVLSDPVNFIDPSGRSLLAKWMWNCYGNCESGGYWNTGIAGMGASSQQQGAMEQSSSGSSSSANPGASSQTRPGQCTFNDLRPGDIAACGQRLIAVRNYAAETVGNIVDFFNRPGWEIALDVLEELTGDPACCFIAGTLVSTPNGLKAIETLEIGDLVLSRDDLTGETAAKSVIAIIPAHERQIWRVTVLYQGADGQMIEESYETTDDHPWRAVDGVWIPTASLHAGVVLMRERGTATVVSIVNTGDTKLTYNLEISDFRSYFVGMARVWVHNQCSRQLNNALVESGTQRPPNSAAHHIVAGSDRRAAPSRAVLEQFGVGLDTWQNGVFVPTQTHAGLHTNNYYAAVNAALSGATSRGHVEAILVNIGRDILAGRFPS